jgi:transposase-like protein
MAYGQGKVGDAKSEILRQIPLACADEDAAFEFMELMRWDDEPFCPRAGCGSTDVYRMTGKTSQARHLWRCRGCGRQFTVRVNSIMEDSPIPLRHWCYAFWAACSSKKGVSALQIKRMTGLSYKSALFLMHRIRWALPDISSGMLGGDVEVDETYVGGKPRPKGKHRIVA